MPLISPRGSNASGRPQLWFNREYLEETLKARGEEADTMNMIWSRVDDPARAQSLMQEVDELLRNSEVPTASESEKSFTGMETSPKAI